MAADKGSPINDRRAEEAFATLATGKAREDRDSAPRDGAGPWKAATFLFLLLALALPLVAGIRESRRDQRDEDRVAAAAARLPAVSLAARDRDYPGAMAAMGQVTATLASVPGLLSTVAQAEDLLRRDLARRDELSGRARDAIVLGELQFAAWKEALEGLLAGDPVRFSGRLRGLDDEVTGSLRAIEKKLDEARAAFAAASARERLAGLTAAASSWPVPFLVAARDAAAEELRAEDARVAALRAAGDALRAAGDALRAGDVAGVRKALAAALSPAAAREVEAVLIGTLRLESLALAASIESADPALSIALYRAAAFMGAPSSRLGEKVLSMEEAVGKAALIAGVRKLSAQADLSGSLEATAVLRGTLADLTGDEAERAKAKAALAALSQERADDLLGRGYLEAARLFAEEASGLGAAGAAGTIRAVDEAVAERGRRAQIERGREALAAGAADYAAVLLTGAEAPPELRDEAARLVREERLAGARAALFMGRADEAVSLLGEVRGAEADALRAHAEFLRGRAEVGVALLKGAAEEKRLALYRAAAALLATDPQAAGRLAARAREIEGDPAELVTALAAALDAADEGAEGSPFWTLLRDEALTRAPLPLPPEKPADR